MMRNKISRRAAALAGVCSLALSAAPAAVFSAPLAAVQPVQVNDAWVPDLGNGRYKNPVIHADYSDPDVIRHGAMYYMTSSSFNNAPGLPLLQSSDMINWELVGHALPQQVPQDVFGKPQHGMGVWAPCLRFHDGKFWIFYPDPDFGIYVITAEKFAGPWSAPHLLLAGKGIIDPTPLWDDDGKAYLLHAWAKSRSGISNRLTLRRMAPDASRVFDEAGLTLIDGDQLPNYRTLEGPKFHKYRGYYYVFAPAGGVESGWQSVFRSRTIAGPYEAKIVMQQGTSPTNGPHQGAWVQAPDGSDWFFHFQDKRAYGRVVHLQPMAWKDGWPVIGEDGKGNGAGQPVLEYRKPLGGNGPIKVPATSDEFTGDALGLQWQWNANWSTDWFSLTARPGFLRLNTQYEPTLQTQHNLWSTAPIVLQKLPAPSFTLTTQIDLRSANDGDRAGLVLYGLNYAALDLRRAHGKTALVFATCTRTDAGCEEKNVASVALTQSRVQLRMQLSDGAVARFAYSLDGNTFTAIGAPFPAAMGRWVGAQLGLYSLTDTLAPAGSHADFDYFRITPSVP